VMAIGNALAHDQNAKVKDVMTEQQAIEIWKATESQKPA